MRELAGEQGLKDLAGIDWVIVRGESGPEAPAPGAGLGALRDRCLERNVPLFFRLLCTVKAAGRDRVSMATHSLRHSP